MADIGVSISLAVSIPLQLMAASAVKSFATLEDAAFRAASRIAGATKKTATEIMQFSQMLSQGVPTPAVGIAQGMEELLKAGASQATAMMASGHFAKFATAANLELDESIHSLVGTFNAFSLSTGNVQEDLKQLRRVSDVTLKAADISIASFQGMVEAMKSGSATSKIYNIDMEETAAVLATYSQRLIEGSEAGTAFRMMVRDIAKANIKERETWDKLVGPGAVYDTATGQLNKVADIIEKLEEATHGMNEEARNSFFMTLGLPSRSFHGTGALFGLTNMIREFEEQIRSSGGYVEEVFAVQMQSFSNQMKLLKNQFATLGFSIGKSLVPVLKQASGAVTLLVFWWNQLSTVQQHQILMWAAIAAALGPALIILGILVRSIGALTGLLWLLIRPLMTATAWFLRFAAAQVISGLASLVAMGPWGMAAAAIIVASSALLLWWKGADMAAFATEQLTSALSAMNKVVMDSVKGMADGAFDFDINKMQLKMKQHQSIMDAVVGGVGNLTESQKMAIIESGVKSGILEAFEGKLLMDMAKATASGFSAATQPTFGDEEFPFDEDEKEQKQTAPGIQQFSATELGSVAEASARAKGQNQLVTIGQHQLQEQKKANQGIAAIRKGVDTVANNTKGLDFAPANV